MTLSNTIKHTNWQACSWKAYQTDRFEMKVMSIQVVWDRPHYSLKIFHRNRKFPKQLLAPDSHILVL